MISILAVTVPVTPAGCKSYYTIQEEMLTRLCITWMILQCYNLHSLSQDSSGTYRLFSLLWPICAMLLSVTHGKHMAACLRLCKLEKLDLGWFSCSSAELIGKKQWHFFKVMFIVQGLFNKEKLWRRMRLSFWQKVIWPPSTTLTDFALLQMWSE